MIQNNFPWKSSATGGAAGGDSMTRGMHELVEIATDPVKAKDSEAITTGENSAETMIDVTNGILQAGLFSQNTAPIFATVYQDYTLRYGLKLSVGPGWHGRHEDSWRDDAFFIECASMFVEGMQVGRIRLRPRDNNISFQNPKYKELLDFLERIVGYYKLWAITSRGRPENSWPTSSYCGP